jgi:hypothetical protein
LTVTEVSPNWVNPPSGLGVPVLELDTSNGTDPSRYSIGPRYWVL